MFFIKVETFIIFLSFQGIFFQCDRITYEIVTSSTEPPKVIKDKIEQDLEYLRTYSENSNPADDEKNLNDLINNSKKETIEKFIQNSAESFNTSKQNIVPILSLDNSGDDINFGTDLKQEQIVKVLPVTKAEIGERRNGNVDAPFGLLKALGALPDQTMYPARKIHFGSPVDFERIFNYLRDPIQSMIPLKNEKSNPIPLKQLFGGENIRNPGGFTLVRIGDVGEDETDNDHELMPLQKIFRRPFQSVGIISKQDIPNKMPDSTITMLDDGAKVIEYFVENIKQFLKVINEKVLTNVYPEEEKLSSTTEETSRLDIRIEDHGSTYDIPDDAFINRNNSEMLNITWNSHMKNVNNSLCIKVSKEKNGHLVFGHVKLRIFKDGEMREYKLNDPVYEDNTTLNTTTIKLTDGVIINIPHPELLDVVIVEAKENYLPHQWLAFYVIAFGLIIAGLIMLLSYLVHRRNRKYARENSISKRPMA